MSPVESPRTFDVFISYAHADERFADVLEHALRGYRAPLFSDLKPARFRVFRDVSEASGVVLSDELQRALSGSGALIVLCSPAARSSAWVNDEIRIFAGIHGVERIVPLLITGLPKDEALRTARPDEAAFPGAFETVGLPEPWAVDFRGIYRRRRRPTSDRNAWFHLLAILHGASREKIEQRERRRRYQRFVAVCAVFAAALVAGWQMLEARNRTMSLEWADAVQRGVTAGRADKPLLLLAISSVDASPTPQARDALKTLLSRLVRPDSSASPFNASVEANGGFVAASVPAAAESPWLIRVDTFEAKRLCGNFLPVWESTFTPDNRYLLGVGTAGGSGGDTLYEWDVNTGALVGEAPVQGEGRDGRTTDIGIESFDFAASNREMVTGFRSYPPVLWRLPSLERVHTPRRDGAFLVHPSPPVGLNFPVVNGEELRLETWSLATGNTLSRLLMPPGDPRQFAWLRILRNGSIVGAVGKELLHQKQSIRTLRIDGNGALVGLADDTLENFDFSRLYEAEGSTYWGYRIGDTLAEALKRRSSKDLVLGRGFVNASVSENGVVGLVDTADPPIVFDPRSLGILGRLSGFEDGISRYQFDEAAKRILRVYLSGGSKIMVEAWDAVRTARVWGPLVEYDASGIYGNLFLEGVQVRLSRDGTRLFVAPTPYCDRTGVATGISAAVDDNHGGCLSVYDAVKGVRTAVLRHDSKMVAGKVRIVHVSTSGDRLISATDRDLFVWDVARSSILKRYSIGFDYPTKQREAEASVAAATDTETLLRIAESRLNRCPSREGAAAGGLARRVERFLGIK
jgi:hypothetical protein